MNAPALIHGLTSCGRALAAVLLTATLVALGSAAQAATVERQLSFEDLEWSVVASHGTSWTEVHLPGAIVESGVGRPTIPTLRMTIPLGVGNAVADAQLQILEDEVRQLDRPLVPYGGEQSSRDETAPRAAPDPAAYASVAPYPAQSVTLVREYELSGGERYAVFRVAPLRYTAASRQVHWVKRARLVVEVAHRRPGSAELVRERAMPPTTLALAGPLGDGRVLLSDAGFAPSESPSVDGSLVEYVIVSPDDEEMVAEWQRLADWKTASGHPAVVRTTAWISSNYPQGSDLAERVRLFLRDAYVHWGLRWAVLGGDTDLIPTRYARSWFYNPSGSDTGTDLACDYYFACLERTWDGDGDGTFGESSRSEAQPGGPQAGDKVDFSPEIQVGRISARTADDVREYLDKYFIYVQTPPDNGSLDRLLMLGEVLFNAKWSLYGLQGGPDCNTGVECTVPPCRTDEHGEPICSWYDGASDCFEIEEKLRELGVGLQVDMLLERFEYWRATPDQYGHTHPTAERENFSGVRNAISDGYGIVQHVGHGDRDRWAIGEDRFMAGDMPELTNGQNAAYFICYGVNCSSAAIDYDSFGEAMVMLPDHGALAYIGCSNVDFPTSARAFTKSFYEHVFGTVGGTVGDGFYGSAATNGPSEQWEIDYVGRFLVYTMVLLGEPGMLVWRGTPADLDLAFDESPPLGMQELSVTVTSGGAAVEGARVCVQKEGEVYVVAETGADGTVAIPFSPQSTGDFEVTASTNLHRPRTESGSVAGGGSGVQLVLEDLQIVDDGTASSDGNGNGAIEVGETVRLVVTLRNEGTQSATGVSVALAMASTAPSDLVTITDAAASPGGGSIGAGSSGTDDEGFLITVANPPPESAFNDGQADAVGVPFDVTVQSDAGTHAATVSLDVTRARLGIAVNTMESVEPSSGDERNLWVGVSNTGKGTASGCTATLRSRNAYVAVETDDVEMEDLEPGAETQVGPFLLNVLHEGNADLEFEIEDAEGNSVHARLMDLRAPSAPDSIAAIGLPGAVTLTWGEALDPGANTPIMGYKVLRAPEGSTEFEAAHDGLLSDHRYMNDDGLAQLSQYSYKVAAVDSAGHLGAYTEPVTVYTSPGMAAGWPSYVSTPVPCSPLICELDGWVSTGREIIFGGECLYAYHGNGAEVVNGDDVGSTMGPYSTRGKDFWGKAAAGDINADGRTELLAVSKDNDSLYCWQGSDGHAPVWAIKLQSNISWYSPTLANIDASTDGRMEVILCAGKSPNAGIYVFQYNGNRYATTDSKGLLKNLNGHYLYQPASVGDVDGDGDLEIVVATRMSPADNKDGALWVVRPDGSTLPHFNGLRFSTLGLAAQQGTTAPPTLADVDGDGADEILVVTPDYLMCFKNNRDTPLWRERFDARFPGEPLPEPVIGDIDGDGDLDVAVVDATGKLWVRNARTGSPLLNFLELHVDAAANARFGSCILANVDQDSRPEILFGDSDRYIYAYTWEGVPARGFRRYVGGRMNQQSLAAWDVDNDGYQNLVIQGDKVQQLTVLHLDGVAFDPRDNPWPMRYRDDRGTGRYVEVTVDANWPVAIQMAVEDPVVSSSGAVQLTWSTAEPVLAFRVLRLDDQATEEILVGEVQGRNTGQTESYVFEDVPPAPGSYRYRIAPVGLDGVEEHGQTVLVELGSLERPLTLQLRSVVPSPLRPLHGQSRVTFALPGEPGSEVRARLRVLDLQGRTVRTLIDDHRHPGVHTATWDGRDQRGFLLSSGLYVLHLDGGGAMDSHRLLVLR